MNKPVQPKQLELSGTELTQVEAAAVRAIVAENAEEEFDWEANDEDIVVRPRPGIAVYQNRAGDVVIRTQNVRDPYDDNFAFIHLEALPVVIAALKGRLS